MSNKPNKNTEEVIKSLSGIALSKGWVKQNPVKVSVASFEQTGVLENDIITLCAGLKQNGLFDEAEVIESEFLTYKKAEVDYEKKQKALEKFIQDSHKNDSLIAGHKVKNIFEIKEDMLKSFSKDKKLAYALNKIKKVAQNELVLSAKQLSELQILINNVASRIEDLGMLLITDPDSSKSDNAPNYKADLDNFARNEIKKYLSHPQDFKQAEFGVLKVLNNYESKWTGITPRDLSSNGDEILKKLKGEILASLSKAKEIISKAEFSKITEKEPNEVSSDLLDKDQQVKKTYKDYLIKLKRYVGLINGETKTFEDPEDVRVINEKWASNAYPMFLSQISTYQKQCDDSVTSTQELKLKIKKLSDKVLTFGKYFAPDLTKDSREPFPIFQG